MQVFALLFIFVSLASAYPGFGYNDYAFRLQELLLQEGINDFKEGYLRDIRSEKTVTPSDLKIYFYTRRNRNNPVIIENNDIECLVNSGYFNSSARTISVTHGWLDDHTSKINSVLPEAILESHDVNVLVSDWGTIAHEGYLAAKFAVPSLGKYLGSFIDKIVSTYNVSHKQFTLIGHSLGAHIAGVAGSATEQKIDLIIGLDPAKPFFTVDNTDECLDKGDADFVHVIHTGGGFLAFTVPIGHSDYFPNGGQKQKGCWIDLFGSCSHVRSYEYLAESISNREQKFWSYKCEDYEKFEEGNCNSKDNQSFMGTLEPDRSVSGSYFLDTNSEPPYAMNISPDIGFSA